MPPGVEVVVSGFRLPDGMLYVGSDLVTLDGAGMEPALVDPALPVSGRRGDPRGVRVRRWPAPSYAELSPSSRRSYLGWLATGRRDPIALSYLLPFFCGLERRLLSTELDPARGRDEAALLIAEVERLREVYSAWSFFAQHATSLVAFARARFGQGDHALPPHGRPREHGRRSRESLALAVALHVHSGKPLTSDWARAWLDVDPLTRALTPDHARLFRLRFNQCFPNGMLAAATHTYVAKYTAMSATFGPARVGAKIVAPDVVRATRLRWRSREGREPLREQYCRLRRLALPYLDDPSAPFARAALAVHLMTVVARAGGDMSRAARTRLERFAMENPELSEQERPLLLGNIAWLATSRPTMAGIKKRARRLRRPVREAIAVLAASMVGASERVTPKRVKALRKVFVALELDPDSVYDRIHDSRGSGDVAAWGASLSASPCSEPMTVSRGVRSRGFAIPTRASDFSLNASRVAEKRRGTREVSRLLAEVFAEEDASAPGSGAAFAKNPDPSLLLRQLPKKAVLDRREFESLTRAIGLLPHAAYDQVNEAAFDACDAPLLAGDDPVHVDLEILEEMLT